MKWIYNDGGRQAAGYKGDAGDCVTRAIAIVSGKPYQEVYGELKAEMRSERPRSGKKRSSVRDGVKKATIKRYLHKLGFHWVACMQIGTGCQVHLTDGELPAEGRLIVSVSRHLTAVIDGVIHDTHDPQRDGKRCVYGYWRKKNAAE